MTLLASFQAGCRTPVALVSHTLALATACAAPSTGTEPESIAYTLTLVPEPPTAVRVTLRVRGEPDGASRLAIESSWAGVENCARFVHGLEVRDAAGRQCPIKTGQAPNIWDVEHEPGALLTAEYELRPTDYDPLAGFQTHFEPVVRADLVHLIGESALIYPAWLEEVGPLRIGLSWSGFQERGLATISSFDFDDEGTRWTPQAFRHAVFLAGHLRILERDIPGGKLRVALQGADWAFTDAELVELVERIVRIERQFADDLADARFLVTVVPAGPRATQQSMSLAGTAMTHCFALFLPPGTDLAADSIHRIQVLRLLAHEYFHRWNGQKIAMEQPGELGDYNWFSEGFTEFYSARLLRRAGLIDDGEWLGELNRMLAELWLSPVATEPAATIRRDIWKRPEIGAVSFHRGLAVALALDEEIRRVSGGKRALDDLFRELLAESRKGQMWDTNRLLSRFAGWTSPEFAEGLRRVVVDGALPDPPALVTEPALERIEVDAHRYAPGFDVDASLATKVASRVVEGGAAYVAGLREGQPILELSFLRDDPEREIKLTVRAGLESRSIRFFPHGEAVRIPRYHLED